MGPMSHPSKPVWAANIQPVELNYYAGIVENAEDLLTKWPHKARSEQEAPQRNLIIEILCMTTRKTMRV